jgi:replicative DNA helicase
MNVAKNNDFAWRKPPHNIEAEQALLGAILVNNNAHERVSDFLEPHHFFVELHRKIYEVASKLIVSGKQANPITLKTFFDSAEPIDPGLTVPQYLGRLATNATTIINARDYGQTILDLATRRGLILIGEDVVNAAYDAPVDFPPKEQIEEAERRLYALVEHSERAVEVDAPTMYAAAMKRVELAHKSGGKTGLSTGFSSIDQKIGRMQPGRLIILAGRTAMGKTTLATEIVRRQLGAVHFFSAEMTSEEVGLRLLSAEAGIPADNLQAGDLDEKQWRLLLEAQQKLGQQRLVIDPTGGISIGQLMARARRVKRKVSTTLIVVDYVQLMKGIGRAENRNLEVGEITGGLKALAKELEVPVLALSQLNREADKRTGNRPQLADLRDSGSLEQDADQVLMLFREEYYLESQRPNRSTRPTPSQEADLAEFTSKMAKAAGKAEVNIAKNRHGASGAVLLQFEASLTRFSDLAHSGQSSVERFDVR